VCAFPVFFCCDVAVATLHSASWRPSFYLKILISILSYNGWQSLPLVGCFLFVAALFGARIFHRWELVLKLLRRKSSKCCFEGICSKIRCGEGYQLVSDVAQLSTSQSALETASSDNFFEATYDWRWLRQDIHLLTRSPMSTFRSSAAAQPHKYDSQFSRVMGGKSNFDAQIAIHSILGIQTL
jgi:hypothetical protein